MEELSSVRVFHTNLCADLKKNMALVGRMRENVGKLLSNVFSEMQKTYGDMDETVNREIKEDVCDRWKKNGD